MSTALDRLQQTDKIIGREHELDDLVSLYRSAFASGHARVAWISGKSGIGKSTLLREAVARMRQHGALLLEQLLTRLGYRATCFSGPQEALSEVSTRPDTFAVLVTDYNMPNLSGLDLVRSLQRVRPALPIVVTSGHLTDLQLDELRRAGVRETIRKELTLEKLGQAVFRSLRTASEIDA